MDRIKCFFGIHTYGEWLAYTVGAKIRFCKFTKDCYKYQVGADETYCKPDYKSRLKEWVGVIYEEN